jgi:membrane protein
VLVTQKNAIYGSFAALPLFFIWLQIAWLIVLMGAEIAFAYQNVDTYEFEKDCLNISPSFKKTLTLRITHLILNDFVKNTPPRTAKEIADQLEIPIRLVNRLLHELTQSKLISAVTTQKNQTGYQPARDPEVFTIKFVLDALDQSGSSDIPVPVTRELETISDSMKEFGRLMENSSANIHLKSIS